MRNIKIPDFPAPDNMIVFIILGWMMLVSGISVSAQEYTLDISVSGIHSDKGTLYLSLYNSEKGYPKDPKSAFRLVYASDHKRNQHFPV